MFDGPLPFQTYGGVTLSFMIPLIFLAELLPTYLTALAAGVSEFALNWNV